LAGRKVLITGAAQGIGHATALLFVEEGASVALLDVQDVASWQAPPVGAICLQVDLLDRDGLQAAVNLAAERLGGLDGVVNCAGVGSSSTLEDLSPDKWDRVLGINLTAPYLISRTALPYLRDAEGATIVNVASGIAVLPVSKGGMAYGASKGGLLSLTKTLAYDLAPQIRVNAVMPGVVNTPMAAKAVLATENPNDAPFVQNYAMKRVAEARELATVILFLTSADSSYVTGSVLAADGGRTFH